MKKATFFALLLTAAALHAQSLPINFESAVTTADFENFDGGTATVIANPQAGGINTSSTIDIYNLQGKLLHTLTPHARFATVETSGWAVGTYVARIRTEKGMGRVLLLLQ